MSTITIQLNGEARSWDATAPVAALIAELQLTNKAVAVAVNREIVTRARWQEHQLQAGDQVDIVRAIGGG
ncbi:sulfur carrier protein ThiS [Undibacterium luofuense]|jgi:sulfur carrier protein|uniref:Sulfur carrier protein ThiS n=1 Tax=Undibacterium luofuense TaxID=2828733 RepID=A0A941DM72_9BURK|nr:sulfur carrier protein ThiS [Undibacterium luofuense]MBR7782375.1 sulfur carrier protein ThiS [Undibacterium luofuense]